MNIDLRTLVFWAIVLALVFCVAYVARRRQP